MKPISSKTFLFALAGAALLAAMIPLILFGLPARQFLLNSFFANITFMGDAIFGFALVFFILFFRNRKDMAMLLLFDLMLTLAFLQLIKISFSGQAAHLYFEANVPAASGNVNFISAHTAVAFTLAFFFASYWKNRFAGIVVFLLAALVAYSRLYFGSETFFSISLGLIPAVIVRAISQLQFEKKRMPVYTKRKDTVTADRHLLPA